MLIETVLIDTNLWHYAYVLPKEDNLGSIHRETREFIINILSDSSKKVAISAYQVAEIIDILRREKVKVEIIEEILEDFFQQDKFIIKDITPSIVRLCAKFSLFSNIHIYDYLVAIPLKGIVTKIYSADDHFQHKDFKEIAGVMNPISPWILREGRKPERR